MDAIVKERSTAVGVDLSADIAYLRTEGFSGDAVFFVGSRKRIGWNISFGKEDDDDFGSIISGIS